MVAVSDLRTGGRQSNATYQYTLLSDDTEELYTWAPKLTQALMASRIVKDVNSDQQHGRPADQRHDRSRHRDAPRSDAELDRQHALRRLRSAPGVDDLQPAQPVSCRDGGRAALLAGPAHARADLRFDVRRQSPPASSRRASPPAITSLDRDASTAASIAADSARNARDQRAGGERPFGRFDGRGGSTSLETMVPLSAFAKFAPGHTPLSVNHQGPFAATTISFNLAEGRSLSEAKTEIDNAIERIGMPSTVRGAFAGTARHLSAVAIEHAASVRRRARHDLYRAGILYESLIHPITDPLDPVLRQRRRGAGAVAFRHPIHHHRRDRGFVADRHRQEERDHDGRLRARGRAGRAQHARCDRGRPAFCAFARS